MPRNPARFLPAWFCLPALLVPFVASVLLVASFSDGEARTLRVPEEYPQVQAAINAASTSDSVLVSPGIYAERIDFIGKAILVGSLLVTTGDTSYVSTTVIDPGPVSGSVVTFHSNEGRGSVLSGLTIRNGRATYGGGIDCASASPTIADNAILLNSATRDGGGICVVSGDPVVARNRLQGNHASQRGGACRFAGGSPVIEGNRIRSNTASGPGGGISLENAGALIVDNTIDSCLTYSTSTSSGGGIHVKSSSPVIRGNRLLYNAALHYGGGICEDHSADTEPGSRAEDNLFEGNYADYGGGALYVAGGAPVYEGNTIHANHAGFAGGGILSEHSDLVLQNNEICHNFGPGYAGGGMQSRDGAAVIADNVFHDNSASAGAAGGGLFY